MNAFSIFGRLVLDDKQYKAGLKRAEGETGKSAKRMADNLKKVGEAATTLGKNLSTFVTAPILAVTGAAVASAVAVGNYADKILDLAEQTGLSTDRLQAFERVAIEAGVSTDVLARAALGLTRQLSSGDEDATRLRDALAGLGIDSRNAAGELRSMDDLLPDIVRNLASMEDATQRNVIANEIFGRGAVDLIPVLALGADRIDELTQEALDLGQVLSIDALNAANQFRIEQQRLTDTIQRTWREVSVALLPVMSQLVAAIEANIVPALRSFVAGLISVIGWFENLNPIAQGTLTTIGVLLVASGPVLVGLGSLLTIIPKITAAFTVLRTVVLAMSGPAGWLTIAAVAVGGLALRFFGARDSLSESIDKAAERSRALATQLGDVQDRESLARAVETLADMIGKPGSPGRVAFVNYANEIAATANTAQDAFELIRKQAFETANAVELEALRMRGRTLRMQKEGLQQMLATVGLDADALRAQIEALQAPFILPDNTLAVMPAQLIQQVQTLQNELAEIERTGGTAFAGMGRTVDGARATVVALTADITNTELRIRELTGEVLNVTPPLQSFSRTIAQSVTPSVADLSETSDEATQRIADLTAMYRAYAISRVQGERSVIIAEGVERDRARAEQLEAEAEHLELLEEQYRAYQLTRIQSDRDARRQGLEAAAADNQRLVDLERAHVAAMMQQQRLLQYARLEASASARNLASSDLEFTLQAVQRSFGPIRSLDDAWRAFASVGLTMTADMLELLQRRFSVVVESSEDAARAALDVADGYLRAQRAGALLGDESADIQGGLIAQISAMETLLALLDPTSTAYYQLAQAIAAARMELETFAPRSIDLTGRIADSVGRLAVQFANTIAAGGDMAKGMVLAFAEMAKGVIDYVIQMAVAELILTQIRLAAAAATPFTWWMVAGLIAATVAIGAFINTLRGNKAGIPGGDAGSPTPPRNPNVPRDPEAGDGAQAGVERRQREMNFGGITQSVQLAVSTPLVQAANQMLDAANVMRDTFGSMMGARTSLGDVLPPFTNVLERMTPVLEQLLAEGVSINVGQPATKQNAAASFGWLR